MIWEDDNADSYEFAADLEFRQSINRQISALVRGAPLGCITDRVHFLRRWIDAVLSHLLDGVPLPDGTSLDQMDQAQEGAAGIFAELEAVNGFQIPVMPHWLDDPIGVLQAWRSLLAKLSPHICSDPEIDYLISQTVQKH